MDYQLTIYKDEIAPQAVLQVPANNALTAAYVIHGGLRVQTGTFSGTLGGIGRFARCGRGIHHEFERWPR